MNTQTQGVQQVPLIQLLRRVPENAKLIVDSADGMGSTFHPVGRLCHEAAEALAQPAQEPVAVCKDSIVNWVNGKAIDGWLYVHPAPAREPVALLEALSDLEHQQWMKWAQSIIDSEPISEARKQRWATMMVDYKNLPDNIQEYDREWARKVLAITHPAPQPAQEPVAFTNADELSELKSGMTTCYMYKQAIDDDDIALYTHPAPSWQGLSDDDKKKLHKEHHLYIPTIEKIESMLKEKNHEQTN